MCASYYLRKNLLRTAFPLSVITFFAFNCEFYPQTDKPCITPGDTADQSIDGDFHVYFGDLHNHSYLSGGLGSPDEAYQYARDSAGLDFFSLSDHDYGLDENDWSMIRAAADAYDEDSVFTALWGFEWSSPAYCDVTVIATGDYCTVRDTAADTFTDLCTWLSTRGGVAFFNHPLPLQYSQLFNRFSDAPSERFVGMEVGYMDDGNHWHVYTDGLFPDDNDKSCFDEALVRGWKIGATVGGDNHSATWGTKSHGRMAILAHQLTREDILAAITARRFYATADKNIVLSFTIDGREMGSTVSCINHTLKVKAADGDNEPFTEVVLFNMNHDTVNIWTPDTGIVALSYEFTSMTDDYFYITIKQKDGDEAMSSPIWIADAE